MMATPLSLRLSRRLRSHSAARSALGWAASIAPRLPANVLVLLLSLPSRMFTSASAPPRSGAFSMERGLHERCPSGPDPKLKPRRSVRVAAGFSFAPVASFGALWLQKLACHVAAGWALIPDQSGLTYERRDPHQLVHYGF